MRSQYTMVAAGILALPTLAAAQPITGLYVGGGGGLGIQQDESVRASSALGTPKLKANFNLGATGVVSAGYGFGNGFRAEVEGDYRYNSVNKIGGASAGGNQEQYGAMVNGLYDFNLGLPIFPYVGVGAGYQYTSWKNVHASGVAGPNTFTAGGDYGRFAYQGIVGAAYPIASVPGLSLTGEYRFLGQLGNAGLHGSDLTALPAPEVGYSQARGNVDAYNEYNHSFLIGVRYAFGVTPPPPPPPAPAPAPTAVPAPAPARTYLVFFDWDKADLTDRAREIIKEAADASTHVQTTRIEVNGYTDLSGTAKYNMKLSVRRADAVKAELIRDGVAESEIEAQGFGETNPLVPTAKGVREPQNRRVEIILK